MSERVWYTRHMSSPSIPTILVTGGAGFLGSHLCEVLVQHANVVCIDNFSTGQSAHIQKLLQHPRFEFLRHDISEPLDLSAHRELSRFQIGIHGIQQIYHLASSSAEKAFDQHRLSMLRTGSEGFRHVLELAREYQATVLLVSTSELYEEQDAPFLAESDRCWTDHFGERAAYQEAKRYEETLLHTYASVYGFRAKIARLFFSYGPRMAMQDDQLLPTMIQAALRHESVELPYSEDARLSLCYVQDVVDGLVRFMQHDRDIRVMNIGSDQETRLGLVAERILQLTQSPSRLHFSVHGSRRVSAVPNIDKARQLLHWLPLTRLDDGLRHVIEYARSKQQEYNVFSA